MRRHRNSSDSRFNHKAQFRFHAELNDFLRPEQRHQIVEYRFNGHPGVKDPIEVLGIPHTEVGSILVHGNAVGFNYQLQANDFVIVYPVGAQLVGHSIIELRDSLPDEITFLVDVNLGKLARLLRLFGFDTLYRNDFEDREISEIAATQRRVVLTRDRRLLHAKKIVYGYWVRSVEPKRQLEEVARRFRLATASKPFCRCSDCNGIIETVEKQQIIEFLKPKTRKYYDVFYQCRHCRKIYWAGSHIDHINKRYVLPEWLGTN